MPWGCGRITLTCYSVALQILVAHAHEDNRKTFKNATPIRTPPSPLIHAKNCEPHTCDHPHYA
ncbi:hypothetical protein PR003_g12726 [Phytophthora rubi]|uniref:Secreted protein n=1 Tax=Phytophthora rubi TaxID=129364 RepID=A0A6A3KYI2_9STRA|nr:hypothetical protein PR002_g14954 [Phytophthora rubi]KAE9017305.1 hypothetical protein PR001_g14434 [Phytophthora rubi]KAE9336013.1 hypothetical protein PR003_g12726 [Phytophthora rubi]